MFVYCHLETCCVPTTHLLLVKQTGYVCGQSSVGGSRDQAREPWERDDSEQAAIWQTCPNANVCQRHTSWKIVTITLFLA